MEKVTKALRSIREEVNSAPWLGYIDPDNYEAHAVKATLGVDSHDRMSGFNDDCFAFRLGTDGNVYWWDIPEREEQKSAVVLLKSRGCFVTGKHLRFIPSSEKHVALTHLQKPYVG